ncbi:UNVERIFIED_CONTAM: hypothetical protein H355_009853 [Colinus virginianus]|nr:hypothetical protein H355_009853 [Colinus virginianus]
MAAYLTHQQKVLRLYKKSLRHLESWCIHRDRYRYFAVLLRDRFDKNKDVKDMLPEWCLDYWHPSEKAMYPDYFAKREQWKKLQRESWEKEVKQLEEETPPDGPRTEALPPARKEGHLPPLWWHYVTRPREIPM